jgi:alpha-L-fucosidase
MVVVAVCWLASATSAWSAPTRGQLGIFLHYGPSSLLNKSNEADWISGIQDPSYTQVVGRFVPNPAAAVEWVRLAKEAGATYIVFTAKHHDGYTLWNSRVPVDRSAGANQVQWNATPAQDMVAPLAKAAHAAGIKLYVYYSIVDWYEHAYRVGNALEHLRIEEAQLRELLTGYGTIDGVWIDGIWSPHWSLADWHLGEIKSLIKSLQPGARITVNRLSDAVVEPDEYGGVAESRIPDVAQQWPVDVTYSVGRLWFYSTQDSVKTPKALQRLARKTIGRGFNLLLNVPPRPDGSIEPTFRKAVLMASAAAGLSAPARP